MQTRFDANTPEEKDLQYKPTLQGFDEVYNNNGELFPHWQYLFNSLQQLGQAAINERHQKAQRILRDDGATYNTYQEPLTKSQPWSLDPVPLVLNSDDWAAIEAGILERSELLNLLLQDIYSKREVLKYRIIPPELLFYHKGFLRPCHGVKLPGEHQLILHAVDMIRGVDGKMTVIGDRTQSPSGAGYALENRTVMSRIFPSLFRDSHVHRLSIFFQSLRQKLNSLSAGSGIPRIVVLTPGAYNETYFEHAYLANYLGYTLVQGGDLIVRDGYVWMKSLEGLRRVDVILRRVDDIFSDPVELKSDSHLGVPGLLEVMRSGRVVVANPLGSGVLENPALLKYLPDISRFFLGRELRLNSVKTYWCGDPKDLQYVMANLPNLVIKPIYRSPGAISQMPSHLNIEQLNQLKKMISQQPRAFVGQEYVTPSQTPAWNNNQLASRPAVIRSFTVANEASYTVMPGGLTRIGATNNTAIVTNQVGSQSKDTWVIASEPEKELSLRTSSREKSREASEFSIDLPSRVVENLFWMGRYAERAEGALRLLRSVFVRMNGYEYLSPKASEILLSAVTQVTCTFPGFHAGNPNLFKSPESELLSLVRDENRVGSVASSLISMLTAAEEVKELLSADTQRVINDVGDEFERISLAFKDQLTAAPEEALDPLVTALMALSGLCHESMIQGMGWRFMDMGRRIERAIQTLALLRSTTTPVLDDTDAFIVLESVLLSVEALITFRRRYRTEMNTINALELVMLDESNPRSLLYQIKSLENHFSNLPQAQSHHRLSKEGRLILEAKTALQLSDLEELNQFCSSKKEKDKPQTQQQSQTNNTAGAKNTQATPEQLPGQTPQHPANRRENLDQLLVRIKHLLQESSNQIAEQYFDHSAGPRPLNNSGWEL